MGRALSGDLRFAGAIGIAIRRCRRQTEATDFGQPTATVTAGGSPRFPPAPCRSPASAALAGLGSEQDLF